MQLDSASCEEKASETVPLKLSWERGRGSIINQYSVIETENHECVPESIEWFIEDQAFLLSHDLAPPPPPPPRQQGAISRGSLFFYKSFNTLWYVHIIFKLLGRKSGGEAMHASRHELAIREK